MHVCEMGDKISVIIVFVNSCVTSTYINCHFSAQSAKNNFVFTLFVRRNMHLKLYYCMEFLYDQFF